MRHFFAHNFPKHTNVARRQKTYMQHCLKKIKTLSVHQITHRLRILNRYLPTFPGPEHMVMDEGTIIDILVKMCPPKWRHEILRDSFETSDHTLDEGQTKLEMIEV